jgi:hypothetical protein
MKKIVLISAIALLFACSADDAQITSEEVNLYVEHYKTTSLLNGTAYVIYENGSPDNNTGRSYAQIDNFNFEPGFTYRLTATKTIIKNDGTNAKTVRYRAINVNSREAARPDAKFRIPLIRFVNGRGTTSFIRRQADSSFILSNEIPFNCNYFCVELDRAIEQEIAIIGTFTHGPEGSYILTGLLD